MEGPTFQIWFTWAEEQPDYPLDSQAVGCVILIKPNEFLHLTPIEAYKGVKAIEGPYWNWWPKRAKNCLDFYCSLPWFSSHCFVQMNQWFEKWHGSISRNDPSLVSVLIIINFPDFFKSSFYLFYKLECDWTIAFTYWQSI